MKSKKRWILVVLVLGAAAVGVYLSQRSEASSVPVDDALRIDVARKDLVIEVVDTGKVKPKEKIEVKSKVAGQIVEVHVQEGDRVEQGDLLLRLDPVDFEREVARAKAEVAQAQNALEYARLNLARKTKARKDRGVAQIEVDLAENEVRSRVISLEMARIALATAQDRLRYTRIISPLDGTVMEVNVEEGEVVTPGIQQTFEGRPLLTVGDLSTLIVSTDLTQIDIAKIQLGQEVKLTFDAYPERTFKARITKTAPSAVKPEGKDVEMFPVEATLEVADPAVKPGMTADVRIQIDIKKNVFSVPIEAVIKEKGKTFVTRIAETNGKMKTERVEVSLGVRNDREFEVVSGIGEEDKLLVDPASAKDNEVEL